MNRIRTATRKLRLALENLETRVTPAVINPIAAWAGGLRAAAPIVSNLDPNAIPVGGMGNGGLTPNFPGGTTDPTTPGIPNVPNPNFPFRTTFLRFGPTGGTITPGSGTPIPGGTVTTPGVNVPSVNLNFNNSFLRTGNPSTGLTTPGVTLPGTPIGTTPGSLGTPGLTFPGLL